MSAFVTALALHETMALRLLGRMNAKEQTPAADAFVQVAKQVAEVQKAVFGKSLTVAAMSVPALEKNAAALAEAAAWRQVPPAFDMDAEIGRSRNAMTADGLQPPLTAGGFQNILAADGWRQAPTEGAAAGQMQPLSAEELSRAFERDARRYDEI